MEGIALKDIKFKDIRRMDHVGRIVIPVRIRRLLNINTYDSVVIEATEEELRVRKLENKGG